VRRDPEEKGEEEGYDTLTSIEKTRGEIKRFEEINAKFNTFWLASWKVLRFNLRIWWGGDGHGDQPAVLLLQSKLR
jgi:hypothetical protein